VLTNGCKKGKAKKGKGKGKARNRTIAWVSGLGF
jgi:hypothetical protein